MGFLLSGIKTLPPCAGFAYGTLTQPRAKDLTSDLAAPPSPLILAMGELGPTSKSLALHPVTLQGRVEPLS